MMILIRNTSFSNMTILSLTRNKSSTILQVFNFNWYFFLKSIDILRSSTYLTLIIRATFRLLNMFHEFWSSILLTIRKRCFFRKNLWYHLKRLLETKVFFRSKCKSDWLILRLCLYCKLQTMKLKRRFW